MKMIPTSPPDLPKPLRTLGNHHRPIIQNSNVYISKVGNHASLTIFIPVKGSRRRESFFPSSVAHLQPPGNKNLTILKNQGCFREVLGCVWRYFGTIFGDNVGMYFKGFGEDFERFLNGFREGV